MIEFCQFEIEDIPELARFSEGAFGSVGYQALPRYFNWLYRDNHFSDELPACWIARNDTGKLIGVMHTMHLEAGNASGEKVRVHSFQNLYVDPDYRSGTGIMLVKKAMKGADFSVFPGVQGDLATTYRAMGYQEKYSFWGRKVLKPIRIGIALTSERLGWERRTDNLTKLVTSSAQTFAAGLGTAAPTEQQIVELDSRIKWSRSDCQASDFSVRWTPDQLRWRLFHDTGPRHMLFLGDRPDEFCVMSGGYRRGAKVIRPIQFGFSSKFLEKVLRHLTASGWEIALSYTPNQALASVLREVGFKPIANSPATFLKVRKGISSDFQLSTLDTDVGFESFAAGGF